MNLNQVNEWASLRHYYKGPKSIFRMLRKLYSIMSEKYGEDATMTIFAEATKYADFISPFESHDKYQEFREAHCPCCGN